MTDFKPYKEPEMHTVIISDAEAILLAKIRAIKFGSIKIYLTAGKLVRIETANSELFSDMQSEEAIATVEE